MNVQRILCPVDFSESSLQAVHMATELAHQFGATIDFVHVWQPIQNFNEFRGPSAAMASEEAEVGRQLEQIHPSRSDVRCSHHLLVGDPSQEIVELAHERSSDMVVMGTHGRTGLARWILGSVAEGVIRKSPCPVITCRCQPKTEEVNLKIQPVIANT